MQGVTLKFYARRDIAIRELKADIFQFGIRVLNFGYPILPHFGRVGILNFCSWRTVSESEQFEIEKQSTTPALPKCGRLENPSAKFDSAFIRGSSILPPVQRTAQGRSMRNRTVLLAVIGISTAGFLGGLLVESRIQRVQAQAKSDSSFPSVAGQKDGEDITGPYEAVADWPLPLTSLPGHEN